MFTVAGLLALSVFVIMLISIPIAWQNISRLIKELRWWHLLWALFFLSGLTFRARDTEAIRENPLDEAAIFRAILVGIVGLVLIVVLMFYPKLTLNHIFGGLVGLMTLYSLVAIISTIWSIYPHLTLYKSMEYFLGVVLIGTIVARVKSDSEFKSLFDWMWILIGLLTLSIWLGVVLWPEEAVIRGVGLLGIKIQGIFPKIAANGVGDLGAILSIVALVRLLFNKGPSRYFYATVLVIGIVTLLLSQSRSPLTGFLMAVPLILFLSGKVGWVVFLGLSVPAVAFFTPLSDRFWEFFLRGQSEELFFSLSGRVYYWMEALHYIRERPFVGYGAYAAGRFLVASGFSSLLSSLHGTWFEVLIGTGVLGLFPLLGSIAGTWIVLLLKKGRFNDIYYIRQQLRLEAIGILTLLSVRSFFSVPFIWHPALTWLLILGYAEFVRRNSHYETYKKST